MHEQEGSQNPAREERDAAGRVRPQQVRSRAALQADGQQLYGNLLSKGSSEAEAFLGELVAMALIDGKVDMREKKMLQTAAAHLGLADKLGAMLQRRA